jgi:cell division protein FtsB
MRLFQIALLVLILILQYRFWFAENGHADKKRLEKEIAALELDLKVQKATNDKLRARVADLKSGDDAVEELARQDLGLVKPGETYIIIVDEMNE